MQVRSGSRRALVVLIALALTGSGCATASTTPAPPAPAAVVPVVVTDAGPVRGYRRGGSRVPGHPVAAPPVGDLRWAPPAPARPWTEVRPATAFGSPCPATEGYNGPRSETEDCLVLNV